MAKYTVTFDVRKGNSSTVISATVDCDSEHMAVRLAETNLKGSRPSYRDYDWNPKRITKA